MVYLVDIKGSDAMVVERFNGPDQPEYGWKPPHVAETAFEAGVKIVTESIGNKPESKKARKRRKTQEAANPLFSEAAAVTSTEKQTESKRPPLLGETVVWAAAEPEKTVAEKHDDDGTGPEKTDSLKKDLPEAEPAHGHEHERMEQMTEAVVLPFRRQPEQQHMARDETEAPPQQPVESEAAQAKILQFPGHSSMPETASAHPSAEQTKAPEHHESDDTIAARTPEHPLDVPPPVLPPDLALFTQAEKPVTNAIHPVAEHELHTPDAPGEADQTHEFPPVLLPDQIVGDIPVGLQRSARDVSRAAVAGGVIGWWLGRRGKRKAVRAAHKQGVAAGMAKARRKLEAEPLHDYRPASAAMAEASNGKREVVEPLSVVARSAETSKPATPVAEALAAPLAAVAALERLRPGLRPKSELSTAAKAVATRVAERTAVRPESAGRHIEAPAAVPEIRAEQALTDRELFKVAKDIKVDGVSLKEIFDAKRIDEGGVRAVVAAYLRGGNVRERLAKEVTAKEMSFERDPLFRHGRRDGEKAGDSNGEQSTFLQRGAEAVRSATGERGSQLAASAQQLAQKAGRTVAEGARQAQHDLIDNGKSSDWIGITAVVVVYSIILLLIIT